SSLVLNNATIKDAINNDAQLALPAPGTSGSLGFNKNIVIDTTAPTVTNVTSTASNGTYGVGGSVPVTVTFSEPVTVIGTPTLTLATGGLGTTVNYSSGSGTSTLVFGYTVGAGQNSADLDYVDANSLARNSSTIVDAG